MTDNDPWESLGIGVPKDDGYGTVQPLDKEDPRYEECPCCGVGFVGVFLCGCVFSWMPRPEYRGYCEECGHSNHPKFDHHKCHLERMKRAMRQMGEHMARRRDQALLDIICGDIRWPENQHAA